MRLALALLLMAAACERQNMAMQTAWGRNVTAQDRTGSPGSILQQVQLVRMEFGTVPQEVTIYLQGMQVTNQQPSQAQFLVPGRYSLTIGIGGAALYTNDLLSPAVGMTVSARANTVQVDAKIISQGNGPATTVRAGAFLGVGRPTVQCVPGQFVGNAVKNVDGGFALGALNTAPAQVALLTWGWALIGTGAIFRVPPFAARMRVMSRPRMVGAPAWVPAGYVVRATDSLRVVELNSLGNAIVGWGQQAMPVAPFSGAAILGTPAGPWRDDFKQLDPQTELIAVYNADGSDWSEALVTFETLM